MNIVETQIPGVLIVEPRVFADDRGYFFESFNVDAFKEKVSDVNFVQDNESKSVYGVVRGLHYQLPPVAQAKLVRVISGKVLDVAVDIRRGSPYFGKHVMVELSEENKKMLYIPHGFAHGFVVISPIAIFSYKVDGYYSPQCERGINPFDATLGIDWCIDERKAILSTKDKILPTLDKADIFI